MPPPDLTTDTPVVTIFKPVDKDLQPARRIKINLSVAGGLQSGLGQRFHLHNRPAPRRGRARTAGRGVTL